MAEADILASIEHQPQQLFRIKLTLGLVQDAAECVRTPFLMSDHIPNSLNLKISHRSQVGHASTLKDAGIDWKMIWVVLTL